MEPIVKIWQFPKNNKNLQDLVTLAQFFTKIQCMICTGFSFVIEWQKFGQKTTAQWHCHCVHTKSTETNFQS
jgi:hypothetical protein